MPNQSLKHAYRRCQELARGSSFYAGLRLLRPRKRRALTAVYAFMRQCDDISDGDGNETDKLQRFIQMRQRLELTLAGDFVKDETLPALRDTIQQFRIPTAYFYQVIDGTEMDLTRSTYATFEDLYRYCYLVASVVGLICIHVFGYEEPQAAECAVDCGIAFQLTNILRDIREDIERNRIYLPLEDLRRFSYTENDLRQQVKNDHFQALMAFEIDRAQLYYSRAKPLIGLLDYDSRPAFVAMFESYWTLLQRIKKHSPAVLDKRVRLNAVDKWRVALKALAGG